MVLSAYTLPQSLLYRTPGLMLDGRVILRGRDLRASWGADRANSDQTSGPVVYSARVYTSISSPLSTLDRLLAERQYAAISSRAATV